MDATEPEHQNSSIKMTSGGVPLILIKLFVLDSSTEEAIHPGAAATMHTDWEEVGVLVIF